MPLSTIISGLFGGRQTAAATITYTPVSVAGGAAAGAAAGSLVTSLTGTVSYYVLAGALAVNSSGAVTTTATAPTSGTIAGRVLADNGVAAPAVLSLAVPVTAATLAILGMPTGATAGSAYSFTPTASGGTVPYTYALTGTLPSGLGFSTGTGTISGTPTVAGTAAGLNITVTDSNGATASLGAFNLQVVAATAALSISGQPPQAQTGVSYSYTPSIVGGVTPYTCALTGALPSGFSFNTTTGAITGTSSTASSTSGLNIVVTDSKAPTAATASLGAFTLVVAATAATVPTVTTQPTVAYGANTVGSQAVATEGVYVGSPAPKVTRQWFYGDTGNAIAAATTPAYTRQAADVGHTLKYIETATNSAGNIAGTPAVGASSTVTAAAAASVLYDPTYLGGQLVVSFDADNPNLVMGTAPAVTGLPSETYNGFRPMGATAAAATAPTLVSSGINGLPSLAFTSSTKSYMKTGGSAKPTAGYSYAAIFVVYSATAVGWLIHSLNTASTSQFSLNISSTYLQGDVKHGDSDSNASAHGPTGNPIDGNPHLAVLRTYGSSAILSEDGVDGTSVSTANSNVFSGAISSACTVNLGGDGSTAGNCITGQVAKAHMIVAANQADLDAAIALHSAWLANKYNISLNGTVPAAPRVRVAAASSNLVTQPTISVNSSFTAAQTPNGAVGIQSMERVGNLLYVFMEAGADANGNGLCDDVEIYDMSQSPAAKIGVVVGGQAAGTGPAAPHSSSACYRPDRGTFLTSGSGDANATITSTLYETRINSDASGFAPVRTWNLSLADTNGIVVGNRGWQYYTDTVFKPDATSCYVLGYGASVASATSIGGIATAYLVQLFDDGTYTVVCQWLVSDSSRDQDLTLDASNNIILRGDNNGAGSVAFTSFLKRIRLQPNPPTPSGSSFAVGYGYVDQYVVDTDTTEPEGICLNPAGGYTIGDASRVVRNVTYA